MVFAIHPNFGTLREEKERSHLKEVNGRKKERDYGPIRKVVEGIGTIGRKSKKDKDFFESTSRRKMDE